MVPYNEMWLSEEGAGRGRRDNWPEGFLRLGMIEGEYDKPEDVYKLEWVVPRNKELGGRVEGKFVAYGNEASMGTIYGDIVLILEGAPESPEKIAARKHKYRNSY